MHLEGTVDTTLLGVIEDRLPAARELLEALLHEARRALRPRVHHVPHQGAAERRHRGQPHALGRTQALLDLLRPPPIHLVRGRDAFGRERAKALGERRMHGNQLALQVRRQLAHLEAVGVGRPAKLVAVGLALGSGVEVEAAPVPGRDLHADVVEIRRPLADGVERVERGFVTHELSEEDAGSFHHGRHCLRRVLDGRAGRPAARARGELTARAPVPPPFRSVPHFRRARGRRRTGGPAGRRADRQTDGTATQRLAFADFSAASSTAWMRAPSSKFGSNALRELRLATKSARWFTNVCS